MRGTAGTITEEMEKDQTNGSKKYLKVFYIAMIVIMAVIAIILVDLMGRRKTKNTSISSEINYDRNAIQVEPNTDEKIDKFIRDYFKARTDLNFSKIFSAYDRDYYKEERESTDGTFKSIIDNIRYERIFVKSYDDITVYSVNGFYENEVVCIVTYDMAFGFTTDKAPMIIIFYLILMESWEKIFGIIFSILVQEKIIDYLIINSKIIF